MSSMRVMNPRVKWFVEEMRKKLRQNVHKIDARKLDVYELLQMFEDEIIEFREVISARDERTISECADIANFAMMIADKINHERIVR